MEDLYNLKDYSKISRLERKIKRVDFLIYLTCAVFAIYLIWEGIR